MVKREQMAKKELIWRRPSLIRREYELAITGEVVARLRQVGYIRAQAEIYEINGPESSLVLSCRRTGFIHQKFQVKKVDPRYPTIKETDLDWKGKMSLRLPDGLVYTWQPVNFLQLHWSLTDENGQEIIHFKRNTLGFGGTITIHEYDLDKEDLLFLLYIGWYLVILKMDDATVAAS